MEEKKVKMHAMDGVIKQNGAWINILLAHLIMMLLLEKAHQADGADIAVAADGAPRWKDIAPSRIYKCSAEQDDHFLLEHIGDGQSFSKKIIFKCRKN